MIVGNFCLIWSPELIDMHGSVSLILLQILSNCFLIIQDHDEHWRGDVLTETLLINSELNRDGID